MVKAKGAIAAGDATTNAESAVGSSSYGDAGFEHIRTAVFTTLSKEIIQRCCWLGLQTSVASSVEMISNNN